jgi:hypothetical protein
MANGTEISTFDPDYWPIELVNQGRTATEVDRWRLPAGTTISNFYNFQDHFIVQNTDTWLFVTEGGRFGNLFVGSSCKCLPNIRLQRFLVAGGNLQVVIDRPTQRGTDYCLGPISAVSSDASVAPSIKRIDMLCSEKGVIDFHFVEQGSPVSMNHMLSSFELQDFGSL